jgi:hypothetical protein
MCVTGGGGGIRAHARTMVTSQIPVTSYDPPATLNVCLYNGFCKE